MSGASAPPASGERLWQVDALRGLMLVLMTLTHLPTRVASPAGQPFGFVSAAEGFVLLSGFMAGMVYATRERREGEQRMRAAFYQRVWKIYLCQAALLLFLFSVVALIAVVVQQEAITGLMGYYLNDPVRALVSALLLVLTMHFAPWMAKRLPRLRFLETMGAASLPVFCTHLVLALLALALFGLPTRVRHQTAVLNHFGDRGRCRSMT